MIKKEEFKYLETYFGDTPTYTFVMTAKQLVDISYVAVRGVDNEPGAVQRTLNTRRINDIKNFILDGHTFFNSFILNWTDAKALPVIKNNSIEISLVNRGAQVIDGQHRIAGFEAAMKESNEVGTRKIIVTLCISLTTSKAAEIFLNINTEQKPVPKSLIYDLFGELVDDDTHAINRATDLARMLNEDIYSPFYNWIKFPGSPKRTQGIELSTFVSALKEHLKPKSTFSNYNLENIDAQYKAILNLFTAIKYFYDEAKIWDNKAKNPYLKAIGFNGAIDFFVSTLIRRCAERKSFKIETMKNIISLNKDDLITLEYLKGVDGKSGRRLIKENLEANSVDTLPSEDEYDF